MKRIDTRPFASLHPLLLLVAVCSGAGCYDWQPPGAPQDSTQPAGPSGAGAADGDAGSGGEIGSGGASAVQSSAEASSVQAASSVSSSSSTTSGGATGGDPAGSCDGGGNCDDCIDCAVNGACADLAEACEQDLGCLAFADCLGGCIDEACVLDCADGNEDGAQIFQDAATCVICDECSSDCAELTDLTGCL